ncbi:hypothetical protein C8F01DRAFT_1190222 [Mycena amicta]|nr:hypothetical protein C8F01DRAFT_1190222 [Mycena amicta]
MAYRRALCPRGTHTIIHSFVIVLTLFWRSTMVHPSFPSQKRSMSGRVISLSTNRQRISAALCTCVLLLGLTELLRRLYPPRIPKSLVEPVSSLQKRAYVRSGGSTEGLGGSLLYFKDAIVLAEALNSSLILTESKNWAYSTSMVWNGELTNVTGKPPPSLEIDGRVVCHMQLYLSTEKRQRIVQGLCDGLNEDVRAELVELRERLSNCTSLLDTPISSGANVGLGFCITPWVRERIGPSPAVLARFAHPPLTVPPTRPLSVGLHIRWSDTAESYEAHGKQLYGSMPMKNTVQLLHDIKQSPLAVHGVNLTVLMQWADAKILKDLDAVDLPYTLVDSDAYRPPVEDLYKLAHNDILIIGQSAYAALAHMIAPPGLTIVNTVSGIYSDRSRFGRRVVHFQKYKTEDLMLAVPEPTVV